MSKPGQMIPPDAYPQMVSKTDRAAIGRMLRSAESTVRGSRVIAGSTQQLRDAVRNYVLELEAAGMDFEIVSDKAHEIRGFAETAGLIATGRIADGLCRYFEELEKLRARPDATIVSLHVSAIARAARAEDEASQMTEVVATELMALVSHKLNEIKVSAAVQAAG